jgi:hypothetical protein
MPAALGTTTLFNTGMTLPDGYQQMAPGALRDISVLSREKPRNDQQN